MDVKQSYMILGGTAAVSLAIGSVITHFVETKKIEAKYAKISEDEIRVARRFYKKAQFSSPEKTVESLGIKDEAVEAIVAYKGGSETVENVREVVEATDSEIKEKLKELPEQVRNIFADAEVDPTYAFDYEEEIKTRVKDEPYVMSHDEFMENESENAQVQVTYYDGDDVLADEKDQPINDIDQTIGLDNLKKFGHGSKDSKVVYIRNTRLELDFEVVLSHGKYVEEVLGFLEHSSNHRHSGAQGKVRRFRDDDE